MEVKNGNTWSSADGSSRLAAALNATAAVKGLTSRRRPSREDAGDRSSLSLLQAMLAQMKADLDTLGPDGDGEAAPAGGGARGLTGFSVALVSTLARLVHLFKQVRDWIHSGYGVWSWMC